MEQQYLIDSNAIIDYLSGNLPIKGKTFMNRIINEIPNISIISKIEILGYNTAAEAYQLLSGFIEDSVILGLTDDVVEETIKIRKEKKLKIPDAIIAATALDNGLILITRNVKDFKKIKGLKVLNPHDF